jgi:hypothetical protein
MLSLVSSVLNLSVISCEGISFKKVSISATPSSPLRTVVSVSGWLTYVALLLCLLLLPPLCCSIITCGRRCTATAAAAGSVALLLLLLRAVRSVAPLLILLWRQHRPGRRIRQQHQTLRVKVTCDDVAVIAAVRWRWWNWRGEMILWRGSNAAGATSPAPAQLAHVRLGQGPGQHGVRRRHRLDLVQ